MHVFLLILQIKKYKSIFPFSVADIAMDFEINMHCVGGFVQRFGLDIFREVTSWKRRFDSSYIDEHINELLLFGKKGPWEQ